jgi:hypothetical protein
MKIHAARTCQRVGVNGERRISTTFAYGEGKSGDGCGHDYAPTSVTAGLEMMTALVQPMQDHIRAYIDEMDYALAIGKFKFCSSSIIVFG